MSASIASDFSSRSRSRRRRFHMQRLLSRLAFIVRVSISHPLHWLFRLFIFCVDSAATRTLAAERLIRAKLEHRINEQAEELEIQHIALESYVSINQRNQERIERETAVHTRGQLEALHGVRFFQRGDEAEGIE